MSDDLKLMAEELSKAADELEKATKHCRVAASHFLENEVPRGFAHSFAAIGNSSLANKKLKERAEFHSTKARIEDE
ncbi:MAG: hypothetical protein H6625_02740 [Bdellovibrionaceae bacterium]|nr:hypothetical protein [Pseudobdellovibrionaceae bacterium]